MVYFVFAENFGWSPRQVDELTLKEVESFLLYIRERNKIREREAKKAMRRK